MSALYDDIGRGYARLRRPDPRIARPLHAALGPARTVLNVGAGTGNYEPLDRDLIAIEPSEEMIRQRPPGSAPVVRAEASALPFADKAFEASLAVLTVHHWPDPAAGLAEMRRVTSGPIVLMTFDPAARPWLTDYLPGLITLDEGQMPALSDYAAVLGPVRIEPLLALHDCLDGFLYAYWRRPEVYLDPAVRKGSSAFRALPDLEPGLARLAADLESGAWDRRFGALRGLEVYDAGYRLVIAG